MSTAHALAMASKALKARSLYPDDARDVGVVIRAPAGKRFPGRLIWDVLYSAGFVWGDGDYFFYWVPSPTTDASQGISVETHTSPGYFLPESLRASDGSGDVEDLEMSFDVARAWKPAQLFDVMARTAKYMARRLGGTVVCPDGKPWDPTRAREGAVATERTLLAQQVEPGSGLACILF
jgi:hypothetical protein